jgi:microcystin-dependent protein
MTTATSLDGWLLCDGTAYSRTVYAKLYEAIGTTYGVGDGSTTFRVPDLSSNFVRGSSSSIICGLTGGNETYTILSTNLPPHTHGGAETSASPNHTHSFTSKSSYTLSSTNNLNSDQVYRAFGNASNRPITTAPQVERDHTHDYTTDSIGAASANIIPIRLLPAYLSLNYIIKT